MADITLKTAPPAAKIAREKMQGLSQWDLMYIKFLRHRLAVASGLFLLVVYTVIIAAEFFAPYPTNQKYDMFVYTPPMTVWFWDENGPSRPFVYGYKQEMDLKTFKRAYVPDLEQKYYIRFFTPGSEYTVLGLFKLDLHFFGVDEPGKIFIFGTDRFGQDVFSRTLTGAQVTLTAGMLSVAISVILGAVLGTLSGYYGGTVDLVVQRVIEFLSSIPRIPLWMTLAAVMPSDWSSVRVYFGIITILAFLGWMGMAREVRGKVLTLRSMDFVMAAKASGASSTYNIFKHMLPNALSHIIVVATLAVPVMIIVETSLSFLGFGVQPPMTSLGALLREAQNVQSIVNFPWLFSPAIVIIVTTLAFNFLGDGLRDAADPHAH